MTSVSARVCVWKYKSSLNESLGQGRAGGHEYSVLLIKWDGYRKGGPPIYALRHDRLGLLRHGDIKMSLWLSQWENWSIFEEDVNKE